MSPERLTEIKCRHAYLTVADPNGIDTYAMRELLASLSEARSAAEVLAGEARKARAILGDFGTLRPDVILEDSLMYEDARRATDAANALGTVEKWRKG